MKRHLSMLVVLTLAIALLSGCTQTAQQTTPSNSSVPEASGKSDTGKGDTLDPIALKVAVLLNGSITDGWSSGGYEGIELIKETYNCETSYIESVSKQKQHLRREKFGQFA